MIRRIRAILNYCVQFTPLLIVLLGISVATVDGHAAENDWAITLGGVEIVSQLVERDDRMGKSLTIFLNNLTSDEAAILATASAAVRAYQWQDSMNAYISFYQEDDCYNLGYWRSYRFEHGDLESVVAKRADFIESMKVEICHGHNPDAVPYSAMAELAKQTDGSHRSPILALSSEKIAFCYSAAKTRAGLFGCVVQLP